MAELNKYAKLMGVSPDADLAEIKSKYGEWRTRFESQIRSEDEAVSQKGEKNLMLLDRAYQALAAHAVSVERKSAATANAAPVSMSVELDTHRIGFNINNMEGFRFVNKWQVRRFRVSWPGAKITFYDNKLKIKALVFATEIEYRHIEDIGRFFFMPFVFRIKHRAPDVLPMIILNGLGLGSKIKQLNDEHGLGLPLSY